MAGTTVRPSIIYWELEAVGLGNAVGTLTLNVMGNLMRDDSAMANLACGGSLADEQRGHAHPLRPE